MAFPKWRQTMIYAIVFWMEPAVINFPIKKRDKY